jgi:hypothetical protein
MHHPSYKQRVCLTAAGWLHRMRPRRQPGEFGILMYHRVADVLSGVPFPTWNVTPRRLHEQLSGLLEAGWEPWPLRRGGGAGPRPPPAPPPPGRGRAARSPG